MEHLAVVLTGFPVVAPDGGSGIGHPFVIKNREVPPSRLFKIVTEFKNANSRLTILLNGCPAVESWANAGPQSQKLSFSTTALSHLPPAVRKFDGTMPQRVLLLTAAPRLDVPVVDRAKNGAANFFVLLSKVLKADPVLNTTELLDAVAPKLRMLGEEVVVFASSQDVAAGGPFLL
jgi:hypothetical protein